MRVLDKQRCTGDQNIMADQLLDGIENARLMGDAVKHGQHEMRIVPAGPERASGQCFSAASSSLRMPAISPAS